MDEKFYQCGGKVNLVGNREETLGHDSAGRCQEAGKGGLKYESVKNKEKFFAPRSHLRSSWGRGGPEHVRERTCWLVYMPCKCFSRTPLVITPLSDQLERAPVGTARSTSPSRPSFLARLLDGWEPPRVLGQSPIDR